MPYQWYKAHIANPQLSFTSGLFWMMVGYYVSSPQVIGLMKRVPTTWALVIFLTLLLLSPLCAPVAWVVKVFVVVALFMLTYNLRVPESGIYRRLRAYSIIMFCMHGTVLILLRQLRHWFPINAVFTSIAAVAVCTAFAAFVHQLSKNQKFAFLKYAY